ncbi:MAG: hypothetical protein EOO02_12840, partial [Chitinophagaceae bacterium]
MKRKFVLNIFAFTAVLNDSLADSDGWLAKIDGAGNVKWSTIINEGKADGLKGLVEKNGFIYTSGFITRTNKDLLLAKIELATGTVSWIRTYRQLVGDVNEVGEECYLTNGDLSFLAMYYAGSRWGAEVKQVTRVFFDESGNLTGESNAFNRPHLPDLAGVDIAPNDQGEMITSLVFHEGDMFESHYSKAFHENDFVWKRYISRPLYLSLSAVDFFKDGSSVFAGKDSYANLKNSKPYISLLKVNPRGGTANCLIEGPPDHRHIVFDLSKKTLQAGATLDNGVAVVSSVYTRNNAYTNIPSPFQSFTLCTSSDCRVPVPLPDDCNAAHRTNYEVDYSTTINTVLPLPDGSILAMGTNKYKTHNRATMKIAANGQLISYSNLGSDTTEKRTLFNGMLPDGSVYSIGSHGQGFLLNNQKPVFEITKWDQDGNVLINKVMVYQELDRINSFLVAPDGFIYVAGSHVSSYAEPYNGIFFLKFDANLNLVWSKKLYFHQPMPFITAMTLHNNQLILAGAHRNVANDGFLYIMKLNAVTGDLVLKTNWKVAAEALVTKDVFVQNDTIVVLGLMNTMNAGYEGNFRTRPTVLKFDMQGKFLSAFRFTGFAGTHQYSREEVDLNNAFTRTDDGRFVFATQGLEGASYLGIITWKFDSEGTLAWGWQYPQITGYNVNHITNQGNHIYISGDQPSGKKHEYQDVRVPFVMKMKETGLVVETAGTDCSALAIKPGLEPITLVADLNVKQDVVTNVQPTLVYNLPEADRVQYMKANAACTDPALCNTLSLSAPAKTCSFGDTVAVVVTKEKSCHAPLTW